MITIYPVGKEPKSFDYDPETFRNAIFKKGGSVLEGKDRYEVYDQNFKYLGYYVEVKKD